MKSKHIPGGAAMGLVLLLAVIGAGTLRSQGQTVNVIAWGDNTYGQTNVPAGATNVVSVAAGWHHSMALLTNGSVVTWGTIASTPAGVTNITRIAAGELHCLALRADGKVLAWGDNSQGQLNVPAMGTNAVAVAAGYFHNLALLANGTVAAWGNNTYGQATVPTGLTNVVAVSAGAETSMALLQNNSIVIWGDPYSESVYPDIYASFAPGPLATNLMAISAGATFNLALRADGSIYPWGDNYPWYIQGSLTSISFNPPPMATNVVAIAAGTNFNLCLRGDGNIFVWGVGSCTNIPASATNVTAIAVGYAHALAVTGSGAPQIAEPIVYNMQCPVGDALPLAVLADGEGPLTYQWLANGVPIPGATNAQPVIYAVLGNDNVAYQVVVSSALGSVTSAVVNVSVPSVNVWGDNLDHQWNYPLSIGHPLMIAAGGYHNLAVTTNGAVIAWGKNQYGQTNVPASATNVLALAGGYNHSLVLRKDGSVVAWGLNTDGQTSVPAAATNVMAIAAGWAHSVALRTNGTMLAWGNNDYGQTNIPTYMTNVMGIAAGYYHTLALLANHTVYSWGSQSLVPASATNVLAIAAGWENSLALRADGTVVAWGDNSYGQCSVPAITNAIAIAAGYGHSLALLSNGSAVAWGGNYDISGAPPGLNNIAAIACGADHDIAMVNTGGPLTFTNPSTIAAQVGGNALLYGNLAGLFPLTYQWCQNGQPVAGATNRWLHLSNLALTNAGLYTVVSGNVDGTATSAPITLTITAAPGFAPALPVQQNAVAGMPLTLSANASGVQPLAFQTQLNGVPLSNGRGVSGAATSSIGLNPASYADDGIFNLTVTNEYGSFTGLLADLAVTPVVAWGDDSSGQLMVSPAATNVVALASGGDHCLALRTDGSVVAWGDNTYGQNQVPASVTNVVAVAEGDTDSLALRADGTVVAWGDNTYLLTNVPVGAYGAVQITGGTMGCEALMPNGTIFFWGNQYTTPTNIVAIASRGYNNLALNTNGAVLAWGPASTTPPTLTNAVAIAAGGFHGLALLANGGVVAWGHNNFGQTTVPATATNVVAIAAGDYHSVALRADGTLITWGFTNYNQTAFPTAIPGIANLTAGGMHSLAAVGQNLSTTVAAGGSTLLTSGNLGTGMGTFQWLYNGTAIAGATNSSLALNNLQPANSGIYQVVVSNALRVVPGPVVNVTVPAFGFDLSGFIYQPQTGSVQMRLIGASGSNSVVIYASPDLMTWQPVYTNSPTVNPIYYTDTPPTNAPQRFYQAVEQP